MWWIFPLFWLLFVALFFFAFRFWGCGWGRGGRGRWGLDSRAILERRLARGEIDEAEYQRLCDVLAH